MGNIVWLASYPKSGNTWFRTFVSNLLKEDNEQVDINHMKTNGIFSSRQMLDKITGIESTNLTAEEIERLQPRVYNHIAKVEEKTLFIKVHDAYTYLESGTPLLGTENAKAIYILRNPLDVAVSSMNHYAQDLNTIIQNMGNSNYCISSSKIKASNQLRQKCLSWSEHVNSWMSATEIQVHLIRYEDMKQNPIEVFWGAVEFMGLDYSKEQVIEAIEASDFKKLKADEEKNGFKERPYKAKSFFRAGIVGDWRNHFSDEQRDQIIKEHKEVMIKYRYIDEFGKLNI